jgi:hypothetical protein
MRVALLKRNLTTILFGLCMPLYLQAQETSSGGLTVTTSPPGAEVLLQGDASVAAITPTTFSQTLIGDYAVTVKRYGYEKYTTHVNLDPSKLMSLQISLTPKTRLKAAARSLFIPGWGQRYTEQKGKTFVFNLLAAGSVATYFVTNKRFHDKYDIFVSRRNEYDSASSSGASYLQLRALQQSMADAQRTAYDAENVRRFSIGAVVGVWGLNLLDALLFFPEDHGSLTIKGVSISPTAKNGTYGVLLSKGF